MSERAVRFLHRWVERNDVLNARSVDDVSLLDLATRLFLDSKAAGISESEIVESWDDIRQGLVDIMVRRNLARPTLH
ncbi:DUF768 domain-containing protein [Mesorhizobium caraganae]|uniref:DUF768 domain-containing protein n=1 Tax=Mesorhizobium caraganae TaxID=483206 RepID=UPI00177D0ED5|nr:DUF768 domain-containing protein [Mesorhizobium caraganae]MBM2712740.1 DUF768 domain-containing protein [Mesorhizobium caraganae]